MNTLFNDAWQLRAAIDTNRIPSKSLGFARSLLTQYSQKGTLSPKQAYWVRKLVTDNPALPIVASVAPMPSNLNVQGIRSLFDKATAKLKRPAIVLDADGRALRLYVAGQASKFPGSVVVTTKASKRYVGRIDLNGNYLPSPAWPLQAPVLDTLKALSDDPAGTAAAYGKATGNCCFCTIPLTDPRSVGVGYGPICAKHYGLPWGVKKEAGFLCS